MLLIQILILIWLLLNLLNAFFVLILLLIRFILIQVTLHKIDIFLDILGLIIVRILKIILDEWSRKASFSTSCSLKSILLNKFFIYLKLVRFNIIHPYTLLMIIQMLIFIWFILIFIILIEIHWCFCWLSLNCLELFLNWLILF